MRAAHIEVGIPRLQMVLVVQGDFIEGDAAIGARGPVIVPGQRVKVLHAGVAPQEQRQVPQVEPDVLPEAAHVPIVVVLSAWPGIHSVSVPAQPPAKVPDCLTTPMQISFLPDHLPMQALPLWTHDMTLTHAHHIVQVQVQARRLSMNHFLT